MGNITAEYANNKKTGGLIPSGVLAATINVTAYLAQRRPKAPGCLLVVQEDQVFRRKGQITFCVCVCVFFVYLCCLFGCCCCWAKDQRIICGWSQMDGVRTVADAIIGKMSALTYQVVGHLKTACVLMSSQAPALHRTTAGGVIATAKGLLLDQGFDSTVMPFHFGKLY